MNDADVAALRAAGFTLSPVSHMPSGSWRSLSASEQSFLFLVGDVIDGRFTESEFYVRLAAWRRVCEAMGVARR